MHALTELEEAYLEQTKKFASLTAALGFPGDESTASLVGRARKLTQDRTRLLHTAETVSASAQRSLGYVYISPATLDLVQTTIASAHTDEKPQS